MTAIFDTWAKYITEVLEKESELVNGFLKHPSEIGNAREALIKGVLSKILPRAYSIGRGEIIDSVGKRSKQMDIVIYRNDFPTLKMPSGSKVFLVESVLATIEVKSTLNEKKLLEALENCASVTDLSPNVVSGSRDEKAQELNL